MLQSAICNAAAATAAAGAAFDFDFFFSTFSFAAAAVGPSLMVHYPHILFLRNSTPILIVGISVLLQIFRIPTCIYKLYYKLTCT